ncbi:MAG: hypothetical protein R3219_06515, partial [Hydrogenovibrio sp.]|nr:hypothetical protein [Hydrogenovibrio sp.]
EAELFGRRMIEQHLADLADCDGVKCLIADRQITEYDPQGRQIDQFDPAWEVDLPEPILSWDWEVIPPQESYQRHRQINRVGASIWR